MSEVDELFGEGGAGFRPRTGRILFLLIGGLVLAVLGLACTSIPGALVLLFGWLTVERELDRVHAGFLPETDRRTLEGYRQAVWGGLGVTLLLFVVQGFLLCNGTYYSLWSAGLREARPVLLQLTGEPTLDDEAMRRLGDAIDDMRPPGDTADPDTGRPDTGR